MNGDWEGIIQPINYPIVFHIHLDGKSTADNPQNHTYGYLTTVTVEGSIVRVEMLAAEMKFEGTLQSSQLKGTYTQLGSNWPLTLTKKGSGNAAIQSQKGYETNKRF